MNILFVANGFPPTSYGGVESYTDDLAKGLKERGHAVTVFCREPAANIADYELIEDPDSPFPVYRVVNDFKRVETFAKLYADPKIENLYEELIERIKPEVVHYNHFIALSSNLPQITLKHKIPSVISLHDYWPICHRINLINAYKKTCPGPLQGADCFNCVFLAGGKGNGIRNRVFFYLKQLLPYGIRVKLRQKIRRPGYDSLLFKASRDDFVLRNKTFHKSLSAGNFITAPSNFVRDMYVQNGYGDLPIHVVPLGVENLPWLPKAVPPATIEFAYIGTLLTVKGVDLLIKAFSRVRGANIALSIYGREDVEPHYTKYIHDLAEKDARIIFRGPFSRDKKEEIYKKVDVVVIPSITNETFSFVAREALESGIPVIASSSGVFLEIIAHEKNGFLFSTGKVEELSQIILRISQDPLLLTQLNCPGDINIMSVDEHVAKIEEIYQQLTS